MAASGNEWGSDQYTAGGIIDRTHWGWGAEVVGRQVILKFLLGKWLGSRSVSRIEGSRRKTSGGEAISDPRAFLIPHWERAHSRLQQQKRRSSKTPSELLILVVEFCWLSPCITLSSRWAVYQPYITN